MLGSLTPEQIETLVHTEVIGRIGCHADGKKYVVPITFVYDDGCIYGHSAVGMKVEMMRKNPTVCFEVDAMQNMANWQSVIASGTIEEPHGAAAMMGMQKLINKLKPLITSQTSQPSHGMAHQQDVGQIQAVVYRIRLTEKTGRYEKR